ncbi:MAG: nucleotidyltransferase substrate binding protein [Flavobacteriaceae bacterium]|jgi:nucleotidyltransferase substrate binding protein (TIGR01987 family)|uniref:Nucleotidyltransferase substrate binding protein n=1 Tax=Flavobacterium kayseriense TaxID=2764714 RepID=A0ABR7JA52_9FLAO|nr:nucleotidyltransferase substrate binding protein [Flavobacterium kayseriense]MBC5842199.1 nucleotidyltransferase substrate binding protein [Flavobacterium kayseriense]MBC5848729.1 nucleotidyltransferase substrate binding protein [Flavobacterium kayseriense]MBU0940592.1 nucleotidyltransferase substrate binding protein [Bacteroidota bacterium]MBX9887149.1 nucleotidyltransferase substrate binding protein [Flavobacteriaceae bacterium]
MENQDVRWKQRFAHFKNAFKQLKNAKELRNDRDFTELELQGVIQAFEVSQELSWKVLKDFLEDQGKTDLFGSKNAVREAFNVGLITNGAVWFDMIKSRNLTSHIYDHSEILAILDIILNDYVTEFKVFENKMQSLV